MTRARAVSFSALIGLSALACGSTEPSAKLEPVLSLVEQPLTVSDSTKDAFSLPLPGLTAEHLATFFVGNSFFNQNWVIAPASVTDRDGLGPLFNARSCSGCHFKDGRGRPPAAGELPRGFLLRIGLPGNLADGAPRPDPVYGDQLQSEALPGVPAEALIDVVFEELPGRFADGESFSLRRPSYRLSKPGYGPLPEALTLSARVAPATLGLGLLEAVPESALLERVDPEDVDGDGISGRAQRVRAGATQTGALGRFGWKAEQPSVRSQVAGAFVGDMGITSQLFPHENHTANQGACADQASGGEPELSPRTLDAVVSYMRTLAVPAPRPLAAPLAARGRQLFTQARCDACHTASLRTGSVPDLPELSQRAFEPFTDLLLHDMGEGLSDARPSFAASGAEWRTAPLWGVGLFAKVNGHQLLLHDGRARGVAEAILWHAGEAQSSKLAFQGMSQAERAALIQFVESL